MLLLPEGSVGGRGTAMLASAIVEASHYYI